MILSLSVTLQVSMAQIEGEIITEKEAANQKKFIEADASLFLGDYETAIEKYREIYNEDRTNDAVAYNMARAYAGMGNIESADKYIKVAIKLVPSNKWYRLLHANLMRDEQRHSEALDSYAWLANEEPDNRYFVENYAFTLLTLERPDEALQVIDAWEDREGVSEVFSRKKFEIYDAQGKSNAAALELQKLASAYKNDTRLWNNLASYLVKTGDKEKAKTAYDHILSIEPKNADAKIKRAQLDEKNGNSNSAQFMAIMEDENINSDDKVIVLIPLLEKVVMKKDSADLTTLLLACQSLQGQYPKNAKVNAIYGDALFHSSQYKEAIVAYKNTIQVNNKVYPTWANLMHAQARIDAYKDLEKTAYDAIDLFPNQVSAYYYYGIAAAANGNFSDADGYLSEAYMIAGSNNSLKQLVKIGQARRYFLDNKLDKASEILSAFDTKDLSQMGLELSGDIAFKSGNKQKAISLWEQAYKMDGDEILKNKIVKQSL